MCARNNGYSNPIISSSRIKKKVFSKFGTRNNGWSHPIISPSRVKKKFFIKMCARNNGWSHPIFSPLPSENYYLHNIVFLLLYLNTCIIFNNIYH